MLNTAKSYAKMGLSVIPLVPKGKTPLIDWKEYSSRIADEKEITDWFMKKPDANIGIVTGTVSGIGIVDADGQDGIQNCIRNKITSSTIVSTGKGRHYYFATSRPINNAVGIIKGVDIRGENGYVVAPPSVHGNGSRYVWLAKFSRSTLSTYPNDTISSLSKGAVVSESQTEGWLKRIIGGVQSGGRHQALVKLCSYLIPRHSYDYVKHSVLEWNQKNVPPMPDYEVTVQLNDIFSRFKKGQYQSNFKLPEENVNAEKTIEVKDASQAVASYYANIRNGVSKVPELLTGFTELDSWTFGIRKGEVYTVGARPGTGKSSFLVTVANSLLKQGKRVLFISTEMPEQEILTKLIAVEKSIPCGQLTTGELHEGQRVQLDSYLELFKTYSWHFCNIYEPNEKEVRKIVEQVQPDVLIFDHLQHIASGDEAHKSISRFVRALKSLAMEYGVAVMVASQLNRLAGGMTPELHHLKECGTIEEESCVVVLLHKEDQSGADEIPIVVKVAKNRYGKVGVSTLMFNAPMTKFEDMNYDKNDQGDSKSTEQVGNTEGVLRLDTPKQEDSVDKFEVNQEEKS